MNIPRATLRKIMKKRLHLSWKKIKRVASPGNSERNLVLRHLFARKLIPLYAQNQHIVNIDESWVSVSDFGRQSWNRKGFDNNHHDNVLGNKVNLIVAVSSEGFVWLSLTQCNTDDEMMSCFLSKLATRFTKQFGAGWRESILFVLDGASYHRSASTRQSITHLQMKIVMSAPYSYQTAPAELWFASLKRGEFNPEQIKSGKSYVFVSLSFVYSSFQEISSLVYKHAASIPRSRVKLFFRHVVIHLFNYLAFKHL